MTQRPLINTIARFLLRSPRWIGENPFVGFFILLLVALLISSLVFYRYVFLARSEDVGSEITQIRFDQQTLQQVIQAWQERDEKFTEAGTLVIRNIFARPQEVLEEPEN
jgi:hypothetical protein